MSAPVTASGAGEAPKKKPGLVILRAGITLAIFAAIFWFLPIAEVWDAMSRTGWQRWLGVALVFGAGHALAAYKWRSLVRAAGTPLGATDALRAHAAGLFANIWLPSIVGGDVIRAGFIARRYGVAVPAVVGLVDRVLDLLALVLLAAIGALLLGEHAEGPAATLLRAASLLMAVGLAFGLLALRWLRPEHLPAAIRRPGARVLEISDALFARPAPALFALTLSLLVQFVFVALNQQLGEAVGIEAPIAVWLFAWPLAKIAALAPLSLGGLGVRESALAGLLAPFGILGTLAVAEALVWQSVLFGFGLLAGAATLINNRSDD